jgi:putative tricarboxylic transport membrane protein
MRRDVSKLKIPGGLLLCVSIFLMLSLIAVESNAADPSAAYPSRPIEYVVHSSPGANNDVLGRLYSHIIQNEKILNQPMVVVNKAGGGGAFAMGYVYERKGNPHIVLNISSGAYIITTLLEKLPFTISSFTPIANMAVDGGVLAVRTNSPFKTLDDLIAEAKKRPRELSMGLASALGTHSLSARRIQELKGVKWNTISFKTYAEAILNLLAGNLDLTFTDPEDVLEQVRAGKLRVLVANAPARYPEYKDAPTFEEAGLGEPILIYRGVVGPPDMPDYAVKTMESVFKQVIDSDRFKKYLRDGMKQPAWMSSGEYGKFLYKLNDQWKQMLTEYGLMKKK